jgi:hypothetical protein
LETKAPEEARAIGKIMLFPEEQSTESTTGKWGESTLKKARPGR